MNEEVPPMALKYTTFMAAMGRHLDMIGWSRANGCPRASATVRGAAEASDLQLFEGCQSDDYPWSPVVATLACCDNLDIVK